MIHLKNPNTVLVIDDEAGPREAIRMILQRRYKVLTCDNPEDAIDLVSSGEVDVVMLDIKMPKIDGIGLLKAIRAAALDIEVALITAYPSMETAIEALQQGAYDYVIKPFDKKRIEEVAHKGIVRSKQKRLQRNLASDLISEVYEKFSHQDAK